MATTTESKTFLVKEELMPEMILLIPAAMKKRFVTYFDTISELKNNLSSIIPIPNKYPELIFLRYRRSNDYCDKNVDSCKRLMELILSNDIFNCYIYCFYLIRHVTKDINDIVDHIRKLLLSNRDANAGGDAFRSAVKFRIIASKSIRQTVISLIERSQVCELSPTKYTHVLYVVTAYKRFYFGIFDASYYQNVEKLKSPTRDKISFAADCVSRAYFKLKEIILRKSHDLYFLPLLMKRGEFISLDIGSSPGGWTKYLIKLGCKHVISVDPADMDAELLSDYNGSKMTYFKKQVQQVTQSEILSALKLSASDELNGSDCKLFDLIVSDMNMNSNDAMDLMIDLSRKYLKDGGFIVFTIKFMDRRKFRQDVAKQECRDKLSNSGIFENSKIEFMWLFANKHCETTIIARRKHSTLSMLDELIAQVTVGDRSVISDLVTA